MANTVYLSAPSQNFNAQTMLGNQYSTTNGILSTTVGLDVVDLVKAGCVVAAPAGELAPSLPQVHGRFYGIPKGVTPAAVLTQASYLYAYPYYIASTVTVGTLNLSVTTGQTGGAAHLGIYYDANGVPGSLVYDSGTQTGLTSTAVLTVTPTANSVVLTPGWYWLASAFTASSTYISVAGNGTAYTNELSAQLGWDTAAHALATSGEAVSGVINTSFTYGSLPSLFPTASLSLNAAVPLISLGV